MKKITSILICTFTLISVLTLKSYSQELNITRKGNVRSGPSTNNEIIGTVVPNMHVSQIEITGDWIKIKLPDQKTGWIHKILLASKENALADTENNIHIIRISKSLANSLSSWVNKPDWYNPSVESPLQMFIGDKYNFYTRESNPLSSLEIIKGGDDIGCFPGDADATMLFNTLLYVQQGKYPESSWGKIIGGAYWKTLFEKYEDLMIFMTINDSDNYDDEAIVGSGGGIKIKFILD